MIQRRLFLAAAAASMAALAGCGEATQIATFTQPGVPTGTITVINQTGTNILDVRGTNSFDRRGRMAGLLSSNMLAANQIIPPGGSASFPASEGQWMISTMVGSGRMLSFNDQRFTPVFVRAGANSDAVVR